MFCIVLLWGCSPQNSPKIEQQDTTLAPVKSDTTTVFQPETKPTNDTGALERSLIKAGLVNVQWLNSGIAVDLRYASDSNFLGKNIYGSLSSAYLEENTAKKLALAQIFLSKTHPNLRILVWDAARPVSCQRVMWQSVDLPPAERGRFVSNPANHSLHNYACAVDVTLIDTSENPIDMGTDFDVFDTLAQPKYEAYCFERELLSAKQLQNRRILRNVMVKAGFSTITSEWWHFNSCNRDYAKQHFVVVP